jgi:hypothetical protein
LTIENNPEIQSSSYSTTGSTDRTHTQSSASSEQEQDQEEEEFVEQEDFEDEEEALPSVQRVLYLNDQTC